MQSNSILLPWLDTHWQSLNQRELSNRLPHALLITGSSGIGKSSFTDYAAKSFLCSESNTEFCGQCKSCKLFSAGTHPDFLHIYPSEGKQVIGVDSIRRLIDELALTPQCGKRKIAVIDPADVMNLQGANCLLKTLEEPAIADVLLLVTSTPGLLPATIRSRCQKIKLTVSDSQSALDWFSAQGIENPQACLNLDPEAPLNALIQADMSIHEERLQLLHDLTATLNGVSEIEYFLSEYATLQTDDVLKLFSQWFATGVKLKMNCTVKSVENIQINRLVENITIEKIFIIYNKIQALRRIDSTSFKTRAVLEGLLADMRLVHMN